MQKLDAGRGLNLISRKLRKVELDGFVYGFRAKFRGDLFWSLSTDIEDFDDLERIRKELSAAFKTQVCIAIDDLEEIAAEVDSKKSVK